ncbi:DUF4920 domain-containing protein [Flagellimonas sp. DF-77]|uniref:DUF4920 domain-containing protein n=1 Tax=Flagellimonas algarum TaxID=3230298 RepID=UPI003391678E
MKTFNILVAIFASLLATSAMAQSSSDSNETAEFGTVFERDATAANGHLAYADIKGGTRLSTQLTGTVTSVCQAKGCWMEVALPNGETVMVKFKDYGFFVPTDSAGKEVLVNGMAFVEEMDVEEQRHYASDAGASKADIAKITTPKRTLRFEASGVQIQQRP